jgi:hypothetical protein
MENLWKSIFGIASKPSCYNVEMAKQTKKRSAAKKKAKPGPKEETLRIEGNWQDAVKKSLEVKKPATGWPK